MNNYIIIEKDILEKDLSDGAFRLFFTLSSFCFGNKTCCYPSQKILSEKLNKSIRSVQRYTKELEKIGLIQTFKNKNNSNIYNVSQYKTKYNKNDKSVFCSFPQRNYNFEELEKQLLGLNKK